MSTKPKKSYLDRVDCLEVEIKELAKDPDIYNYFDTLGSGSEIYQLIQCTPEMSKEYRVSRFMALLKGHANDEKYDYKDILFFFGLLDGFSEQAKGLNKQERLRFYLGYKPDKYSFSPKMEDKAFKAQDSFRQKPNSAFRRFCENAINELGDYNEEDLTPILERAPKLPNLPKFSRPLAQIKMYLSLYKERYLSVLKKMTSEDAISKAKGKQPRLKALHKRIIFITLTLVMVLSLGVFIAQTINNNSDDFVRREEIEPFMSFMQEQMAANSPDVGIMETLVHEISEMLSEGMQLEELRVLAVMDNIPAQFVLASHYYIKGETESDDGYFEIAADWMRRAAILENPLAQGNMGVFYQRGIGVPINIDEAMWWYEKAAEQGLVFAMTNLAGIYALGSYGVDVDPLTAAIWYTRAAELGRDAFAMNALGMMHINGEATGGRPNYIEAARWFRRAANLGEVAAMRNLGEMYQNGHIATANPEMRAEIWLGEARRLEEEAVQGIERRLETNRDESSLVGAWFQFANPDLFNIGDNFDFNDLLHVFILHSYDQQSHLVEADEHSFKFLQFEIQNIAGEDLFAATVGIIHPLGDEGLAIAALTENWLWFTQDTLLEDDGMDSFLAENELMMIEIRENEEGLYQFIFVFEYELLDNGNTLVFIDEAGRRVIYFERVPDSAFRAAHME